MQSAKVAEIQRSEVNQPVLDRGYLLSLSLLWPIYSTWASSETLDSGFTEIYTEDGWIKSGDLLYRDENWNFFYVERLKMLLKYRNHHISPTEVESVIIKHPGVQDVAVTGIPDDECGDLVVACVVPQNNTTLTAQEIKDLVKESLADTKQLRGGVIFMKQFPLTSTSKVNRAMLKKIVRDMKRE
ncbi:Luciferin 4-monooxygenase [Papilio machaon]|uniref:Luciferin 4-monooxygenase n=1 Tax=Papilio machaon TaxID=76193 RepID=A0A0N1PKC2_PAPMA|nr:Luciferin 4-monooxygenase [Papilio machaon]